MNGKDWMQDITVNELSWELIITVYNKLSKLLARQCLSSTLKICLVQYSDNIRQSYSVVTNETHTKTQFVGSYIPIVVNTCDMMVACAMIIQAEARTY